MKITENKGYFIATEDLSEYFIREDRDGWIYADTYMTGTHIYLDGAIRFLEKVKSVRPDKKVKIFEYSCVETIKEVQLDPLPSTGS